MKAIAFIAVADMSKANFATIGDQIYSKTPNQIWQAEQQKYPIIMNGGYFVMGAGKSVSLLCREGEVLAVNSQEEIRSQKVITRHEVSFSCQKMVVSPQIGLIQQLMA